MFSLNLVNISFFFLSRLKQITMFLFLIAFHINENLISYKRKILLSLRVLLKDFTVINCQFKWNKCIYFTTKPFYCSKFWRCNMCILKVKNIQYIYWFVIINMQFLSIHCNLFSLIILMNNKLFFIKLLTKY